MKEFIRLTVYGQVVNQPRSKNAPKRRIDRRGKDPSGSPGGEGTCLGKVSNATPQLPNATSIRCRK
jgi:hypothetical protein